MNRYESPRSFLKALYDDKKRRNPRYSLRAWARKMNVSVSTISRIVSGERKMTCEVALKMVERMELSPVEKAVLVLLILKENARNSLESELFHSLVVLALAEESKKKTAIEIQDGGVC